jgi:hypothetical protein
MYSASLTVLLLTATSAGPLPQADAPAAAPVAQAAAAAPQDADGTDGSPAQPAAPRINPQLASALVNLTIELHALQSMIDSLGNMNHSARTRIEAMNAFLKEKSLDQGFATWKAGLKAPAAPPPSQTFQKAYQVAMEQQRLQGSFAPPTQDLAALGRQVAATTSQAQAAWNDQNGYLQQVAEMSQYLSTQNALKDYQTWAQGWMAQQKAAQQAKYAAANAAYSQQQKAYYQHLRELQEQWDKSGFFSDGFNYNYAFSQGATTGYQFSQMGIASGVANPYANYGWTPPVDMGMLGPYYSGGPSGEATTGNLNQAFTYTADAWGPNSYYGGWGWNSYCDPYYDVWGWPRGTTFEDRDFAQNQLHNSFRRAAGPAGPAGTPAHEGVTPTGGGRR